MLSVKFYLPYLFRHTYFLRLVPNATSALESKMVHTDLNPRYSEQIKRGFFVLTVPEAIAFF